VGAGAPRGQPVTVNALSVDVEDYYHVWALSSAYPRDRWHLPERRVDRNTRRLLDLFDRAGVQATFFILGIVAEEFPDLVRDIAAAGHEVASHGYSHAKVFELTPDAFAEELRRTKGRLEDISGQAVIGYRAPSFSIGERTPWAYEKLVETGHLYSSSIHPIAHDHYGAPDHPRHRVRCARTGLVEIPVAVVERFGRRLSCGGGGFFRLLPYAWSRMNIARLNRRDGLPATFYLHPWEIDADQPVAAPLSRRSRLRHYSRLSAMEPKLARLLQDFSWDRIDRLYGFEPGTVPQAAPEPRLRATA
jgi:polysaccharide deacetylase family protein (PEP-CTERM system associated)